MGVTPRACGGGRGGVGVGGGRGEGMGRGEGLGRGQGWGGARRREWTEGGGEEQLVSKVARPLRANLWPYLGEHDSTGALRPPATATMTWGRGCRCGCMKVMGGGEECGVGVEVRVRSRAREGGRRRGRAGAWQYPRPRRPHCPPLVAPASACRRTPVPEQKMLT